MVTQLHSTNTTQEKVKSKQEKVTAVSLCATPWESDPKNTYKVGRVHDLVLDRAFAVYVELQLHLLLLYTLSLQLCLWLLLLTLLL